MVQRRWSIRMVKEWQWKPCKYVVKARLGSRELGEHEPESI